MLLLSALYIVITIISTCQAEGRAHSLESFGRHRRDALAGSDVTICTDFTGLSPRDIVEHRRRNNDCSLDCITAQGTVLTSVSQSGTKCGNRKGYKCHLAHVPDLDIYPAQGASDTFVVVEVSEGNPGYETGSAILCHTHVIQDNSYPRWRNFICKSNPLKRSAKLHFQVLDSDKPSVYPDKLGQVTESVETLVNKGPIELPLDKFGRYWLKVEVKGEPMQHVLDPTENETNLDEVSRYTL